MRELTEWLATTRFDPKPWLILGKGPTFSRRDEFDLTGYHLFGLNHVVREVPVEIAHVLDVDVVEACSDVLSANCQWLVMPRVPHVRYQPSLRRLEDFVENVPVLGALDRAGRLIWYNASTSSPIDQSPPVRVKNFSSEAALSILGKLGARTVRSLGVDGGRGYSAPFGGLNQAIRLLNAQPNFDSQFTELEEIAIENAIDYAPLVEPIRIFIGADTAEVVPARVLEHSIRMNTEAPVRVELISNQGLPRPRSRANRPRTAFSFCRFKIPELCGYRGRGIYMDSDMVVFGDVNELWERPFAPGTKVQCTRQDETPAAWTDNAWFKSGRQMSVLVLDCGALDWRIEEVMSGLDRGEYGYQDLLSDLCLVAPSQIDDSLAPEWNHLEKYEPGTTKLLHYTVVPTQPWLSDQNSLAQVWLDVFAGALRAGAISPDELGGAVERGDVRPELIERAAAAIPAALPRTAVELEIDALRLRMRELEVEASGMLRWAARRVTPTLATLVRERRRTRR